MLAHGKGETAPLQEDGNEGAAWGYKSWGSRMLNKDSGGRNNYMAWTIGQWLSLGPGEVVCPQARRLSIVLYMLSVQTPGRTGTQLHHDAAEGRKYCNPEATLPF